MKNKLSVKAIILAILFVVPLFLFPAFAGESENYSSSPEVIDEGGGKMSSSGYNTRTSIGQSAIGFSSYGDRHHYWGYIWSLFDPPNAPEPVFPADSDTVTWAPVFLVWTVPTDLDGDSLDFIVHIATTDTFGLSTLYSYNSMVHEMYFSPLRPYPEGVGTCTLFVPTYLPDDRYWWRVRAIDSDTVSEYSIAWNFLLAIPPEAPTGFATNVCCREVILEWTPSADIDIEGCVIYRGYHPDSLNIIDTLSGIFAEYTDIPYPADTTYYYAISFFDSIGMESPLSEIDSAYPFRYYVHDFSYRFAGDNRIELSWSPTAIDTEYRIYYAEGDTFPSISSPVAVLFTTDSSWISPPGMLAVGNTYTFAIHCKSVCDYFDDTEKTYVVVAVRDTGYEFECSSVHLVNPKPGRRLTGNCVLLRAKSNCPDASLANIDSVLFQKKPLPGGTWADIVLLSADSLIHPNPDSTSPYFIHWNTYDEAEGEYLLRAIAYDTLGNPDLYPGAIPILIDRYHPECERHLIPDGGGKSAPDGNVYEYWERIYNHDAADIDVGDFDDTEDWIHIPEGTVELPDIIYYRMIESSFDLDCYYSIDEFFEIVLQSGIESVAGDSIGLCQQYPDHNNDGRIDETMVLEDSIGLFKWDVTEWDSISHVLNTDSNTVSAGIYYFGTYALLSSFEMSCIDIYISDGSLHDGVYPETVFVDDTVDIYGDSTDFGPEFIRISIKDMCPPHEVGISWIDVDDSICGLIHMSNTEPMHDEIALQSLFTNMPEPNGIPVTVTDFVQWCDVITMPVDTSFVWFRAFGSTYSTCYGDPGNVFGAYIHLMLHLRVYLP